MRKFQVLEVAIAKLQQVKWLKDRDGFRVRCQSAWRHLLQMTGEKTSVHKPLLSAGDVTDKGHALRLDGNVGYIIQNDSPNSDSNAYVFSKSLRATFVEWSH